MGEDNKKSEPISWRGIEPPKPAYANVWESMIGDEFKTYLNSKERLLKAQELEKRKETGMLEYTKQQLEHIKSNLEEIKSRAEKGNLTSSEIVTYTKSIQLNAALLIDICDSVDGVMHHSILDDILKNK